jgi:Holliday junction resolvasome RuvABC endonuclease subunit
MILGLDLQSRRLGWCVLDDDGVVVAHGIATLGVRLVEEERPRKRGGPRLVTRTVDEPDLRAYDLRAVLGRLLDQHSPAVVAYEKVRHHAGVEAAHGWGAAEAAVREVWRRFAPSVEIRLVGVQAGKRALTGYGGSDKRRVQDAAQALAPGTWGEDDADALGVALAARGGA